MTNEQILAIKDFAKWLIDYSNNSIYVDLVLKYLEEKSNDNL